MKTFYEMVSSSLLFLNLAYEIAIVVGKNWLSGNRPAACTKQRDCKKFTGGSCVIQKHK